MKRELIYFTCLGLAGDRRTGPISVFTHETPDELEGLVHRCIERELSQQGRPELIHDMKTNLRCVWMKTGVVDHRDITPEIMRRFHVQHSGVNYR